NHLISYLVLYQLNLFHNVAQSLHFHPPDSITTLPTHFFFFNAPPTTEIYTLSLHDALPISAFLLNRTLSLLNRSSDLVAWKECRSEERFSRNAETDLVCRLLLEKKKKKKISEVVSYNVGELLI